MSMRTIMVVFLALFCGAAMAFGVLQSSPRETEPAEVVVEMEPVLVATVDLQRGARVGESDIEVRQWPVGLAPPGTLRSIEEAAERVMLGQVLEGELVLEAKLTSQSGSPGVASLVPPGKRAYTIMASRVASNVAGFVLPGNRVDVLLNLRDGRANATGGGSTITLLQAVQVLAVDQRLEAPVENKVDLRGLSSVTLVVTPEQANQLDLGQNMGHLTLALRNPLDDAIDDVEEATIAKMRLPRLAPSTYLDGDSPPPPEFATSQNQTDDPPANSDRSRPGIVTLRGSHRGQIWLSDAQE